MSDGGAIPGVSSFFPFFGDSCIGRCGGESRSGNCKCDALCVTVGDCCNDFVPRCRFAEGESFTAQGSAITYQLFTFYSSQPGLKAQLGTFRFPKRVGSTGIARPGDIVREGFFRRFFVKNEFDLSTVTGSLQDVSQFPNNLIQMFSKDCLTKWFIWR